MEIPTLSAANSKARANDEAEARIHSGHCDVQETGDLGGLGDLKNALPSIGIFCLTLKGILF